MNSKELIKTIESMSLDQALDLATYMAEELDKQEQELDIKIKDQERIESMATDPEKKQEDSDVRHRLGL